MKKFFFVIAAVIWGPWAYAQMPADGGVPDAIPVVAESATQGEVAPSRVPFEGSVRIKGDRTPLPNIKILVCPAEGECASPATRTTDADGKFSFESLAPGSYVVRLRGATIVASENPLQLQPGRGIQTIYYVTSKSRYSATIRGKRAVEETVEYSLRADEIKRIAGTQGDTIKAVQNLPGIARSSFSGGQLVVWGAAPGDTRTYIDGVAIPTTFHFAGLRSTVNSEVVSSVSFLPGGFGVERGRGTGGVIEIESRRPRADGYHGLVQIDVIDAQALAEGKIGKRGSFLLSIRRSLLDAWVPYVSPSSFRLVPTYYDYQAKFSLKLSGRDDLDFFFFGSDDQLDLRTNQADPSLVAQFRSHIFYHRLIARWQRRLTNGTFTIASSLGYDVPFQVNGQAGTIPLTVNVSAIPYTVRATLRLNVAPFLRLDAGVDFEGYRYDVSATGPVTGPPREGDPGTFQSGSGIVSDKITLHANHVAPFAALNFSFFDKKLLLVPQLRLETYTFTGYGGTPDAFTNVAFRMEPRLSLRYRVLKWLTIKAAVGVYNQPPQPQNLFKQIGNTALSPQFTMHYVLGAEFAPTSTLSISVQGFYKDLRQLVVRGATFTDPLLVNDGVGRVYGGELLVRQELWKNFFGWVSYTLSRSERREHPDTPWRVFQFDQTHILTVIGSYVLPRGFQVGFRFRYVTGNPVTPITGSYFDSSSGNYIALRGPTYSARLSDFHALDIRGDKTWTFNRWKLSLYIDIQNVYNYQSTEGIAYNFDYTQQQPVSGLPIVPAFGLRGEF